MDKKLYDLMDWAEIEAIVYSEHDHPEQVLGPHRVRGGILIQAFLPEAKTVFVKNKRDGKLYRMTMADEEGFFATLLPGKKIPPYELIARYEDGREQMGQDPYYYAGLTEEEDWKDFPDQGEIPAYQRMGAHPVKVVGEGQNAKLVWEDFSRQKRGDTVCQGTHFAVHVPYAMRVSVVGDFNHWDGRVHPMMRQGTSDIFTLFLPEVGCGDLYKLEVKWNSREYELQRDAYTFHCETPPSDAGIITDIREYEWMDRAWMERRKEISCDSRPMSIYEVYLGSWKREDVKREADKELVEKKYWNYREIAPKLAEYLEEMGYTHVELLPVMEYLSEASLGYETTGYYAPTARYGSPQDFMYFVDTMHQKGIGVILDWAAVYKYCREGADSSDFLVENALYWKDCYHVDGLRVIGMESIVRLDYGKAEGTWLPNQYGGNEDFDGAAFLKKLSSRFHEAGDGALLIAEDASSYPKVTDSLDNGGLGFDLKWNGGWTGDILEYMAIDPLFRKGRHSNLLNGMLYAYSERFVLMFSHNHVMNGEKTLLMKMPGERNQKYGNFRVALGYMMTHPGKKLLFMGQEFARSKEWDGIVDLSWDELEKKEHLGIKNYARQWNYFYQAHPALYELDYEEQGFEWISCMDADHSIIAFLRRAREGREELLVICNFTPVLYENFRVGVPRKGMYREIFNSDDTSFGGAGYENSGRVMSKEAGWDGRENSICINVPPLSVCVFQCVPERGEEE